MTRVLEKAAVALGVTLLSVNGDASDWGTFQADRCVSIGVRQYSSILWNIPWGWDWGQACRTTPATINGVAFPGATRCVVAWGHEWGQFDVPDQSCPHWGDIAPVCCDFRVARSYLDMWGYSKADFVITGTRYRATLFDIPWNVSWMGTCVKTSATIAGADFSRPDACLESDFGVYGYFNVPGTCSLSRCSEPR